MKNPKLSNFYWQQRKNMEEWRDAHISTKEHGTIKHSSESNQKKYSHIVPFENWKETLYDGIRSELTKYITIPGQEISAHDGVHSLLSSWVLCANLYFLTKTNVAFRTLMTEFLKQRVSDNVASIEEVELEFAFPKSDLLSPNSLLGETTGSRGKKQTSPDVAFLVKTNEGTDGIILTESKYTEPNFYGCSTNPETAKYKSRNLNPDFSRCMQSAKGYDYKLICHQTNMLNKKYMNLLDFSNQSESILNNCPAATDGYQLFRQQALAEGIAKSGRFGLVVSSVAYDGRNNELIGCLRSTGITNFTDVWGKLFTGKALFKTWTHQEWVDFVRKNQVNSEFAEWVKYMEERYGY